MKRVIERSTYNTETAVLIATNDFSDGTNRFDRGHTSSLYRTKKGNYFKVFLTCWQGERNELQPVGVVEAIESYERMFEQTLEFEEAFPEIETKEA